MDDAGFVGSFQRRCYLPRDAQRFIERHGAVRDAFGERRSFDQFHDQIIGTDVVERADIGMIQRRDSAGLTLEPVAELLRRKLDGHFAPEPSVGSTVDFAHSSSAESPRDSVRTADCFPDH
jgi:hypothetical protein